MVLGVDWAQLGGFFSWSVIQLQLDSDELWNHLKARLGGPPRWFLYLHIWHLSSFSFYLVLQGLCPWLGAFHSMLGFKG